MSHPAQRKFCKQVKKKFRSYFRNSIVIDVGSLDINGSNRYLFWCCYYKGIDVYPGKNVDVVGCAHQKIPEVAEVIREKLIANYRNRLEFESDVVDVMISTEALEHDKHFELTLKTMYHHLRPGGLMLITAGGNGREEHGTTEHHAWCSPGTNDYYKNVSNEMFLEVLPPRLFNVYYIGQDAENKDFQFYGIKKYA